jgi:tetratricopeptide (TPR) repeat protein
LIGTAEIVKISPNRRGRASFAEGRARRSRKEAERLAAQQTEDSLRRAVAKYEEASRLYRTLDKREKEAECLLWAGLLSHQLDNLWEALEYFTQARALYHAIGDSVGEAVVSSKIDEVSSGRNLSDRGEEQKRPRHTTTVIWPPLSEMIGGTVIIADEGETMQITPIRADCGPGSLAPRL